MGRVLVIGGSYFFGRVFTIFGSKEHELTLLNRGSYSMQGYGVKEIKADRRALGDMELGEYDAIVDFCAYCREDILEIVKRTKTSQYILISTVDVCRQEAYEGQLKKESCKYISKEELFSAPSGIREYILGKIGAEEELKKQSGIKDFSYTILRPGMLYGPYNYANRESVFVAQMVGNGEVFVQRDADRKYSLCYVTDAAKLTLAVIGNEKAYGEVYNLAGGCATGEEIVDKLAENCKQEIRKIYISEEDFNRAGIEYQYGGKLIESQLYDGSKICELTGIGYTDISLGMQKTYAAFAEVFGHR